MYNRRSLPGTPVRTPAKFLLRNQMTLDALAIDAHPDDIGLQLILSLCFLSRKQL
jgi:hypothetical protein